MQTLTRHACGLLFAITLAGCSRDEPSTPDTVSPPPVVAVASSLDDERTLILPDLMDLVIDPPAAVLFAAADGGTRHAFQPRADEAWQAVADSASQLAQAGEALAEPALARGRADWIQWVAAMREGAAFGLAAARQHDQGRLDAAGAQVRASCQACHARYAAQVTETLAPRVPG